MADVDCTPTNPASETSHCVKDATLGRRRDAIIGHLPLSGRCPILHPNLPLPSRVRHLVSRIARPVAHIVVEEAPRAPWRALLELLRNNPGDHILAGLTVLWWASQVVYRQMTKR